MRARKLSILMFSQKTLGATVCQLVKNPVICFSIIRLESEQVFIDILLGTQLRVSFDWYFNTVLFLVVNIRPPPP